MLLLPIFSPAADHVPTGFLATMKEKRTFTPPWQTPAYSDAGFATLGRVLERITGMKYEAAIHYVLSIPLGLNSTSTPVPTGDGVNALAVTDTLTTWGWDNQITAP
jgi:CubicO group peptidase (beta-lactamase class C family)